MHINFRLLQKIINTDYNMPIQKSFMGQNLKTELYIMAICTYEYIIIISESI